MRKEAKKRRELYLAATLSSDGLLPLTVLIKLHSSTNEVKGLNMKMNDGGRMVRMVAHDLSFGDYLPGLCKSSSSRLRARRVVKQ